MTFVFSAHSLVGYRDWVSARPRIHIILDEKDKKPANVEIRLKCHGAREFKISNHPTFSSSTWQKMTSKIAWRLDPFKDIAVIWVIFKRKNPTTGKYEISSPISYTIDKKNPYKKITSYDNGYIDWTDSKIILKATGKKSKNNKARYDISEARELAEEKLTKFSYEILKQIPISYQYTLGEFLKIDKVNRINVNAILNSRQLKEINHPKVDQVELTAEITFYARGKDSGLAFDLKQTQTSFKIEVDNNRNTIFDILVIDVRGIDYFLSMYPKIVSDDGEPVINIFYYTNAQSVYIKYLRYLEEAYLTGKSTFLEEKNQKSKTRKPNMLYVRATRVSEGNRSKIFITRRYKELIQSNPGTMHNICNGQMFILVD